MNFKLIIFCVLLGLVSSCKVQNVMVAKKAVLQNDSLISESQELLAHVQQLYINGQIDSVSLVGYKQELNNLLEPAVIRQRNIKKFNVLTADPLSRIEERRTIDALKKTMPNYSKDIEKDASVLSSLGGLLLSKETFFNNAKAHTVEKKAYYDVGKYVIPYKIKPQAMEVYAPMVDSIFMIAQSKLDQNTQAYILISGYADASPIIDSSELYNDLHFRMGRKDITYDEMKMYISHLRCYDIASIIETLISQKRKVFGGMKNLKIDIDREGFGISKPHSAIEYQAIDERRRTVHVQWYILSQ